MGIMDTGLLANSKQQLPETIPLYCNLCFKAERSISVTTENPLTHTIGNSCIYKGDWKGLQMSQCTSMAALSKLKDLR